MKVFSYNRWWLLFVGLFYTDIIIAEGNIFKSPTGSLYTLTYNSEYQGANVLTLTMTHVSDEACVKLAPQLARKYFEVQVNNQYVPLTPPASGTTWNRNYVVVDKVTKLCQSGTNNTLSVNHFMYPKTYTLHNESGDVVNSSYEIYKKTMQLRESHQLFIK